MRDPINRTGARELISERLKLWDTYDGGGASGWIWSGGGGGVFEFVGDGVDEFDAVGDPDVMEGVVEDPVDPVGVGALMTRVGCGCGCGISVDGVSRILIEGVYIY